MKNAAPTIVVVALSLSAGLAALAAKGPSQPVRPSASRLPAVTMSTDAQNRFVAATCATCHDDEAKPGGLSLEHFDAAKVADNAEVTERMIRKLRAGMMPPASVAPRPDSDMLASFATALETRVDQASLAHPNPGHRPFQRLNRAEYMRAVRDLLDVDVDVTAFLSPDTVSSGYDNIADVQSFSPIVTEGYLRAASRIATTAIGDRTAHASEVTYKIPRTTAQLKHVDGAPWGTRGGLSVVHTFPADGDYSFRVMLHSVPSGRLYASTARGEQIEVSVNGERVALLDIDYHMSEADPNGMNLMTPRVHLNAGPQRVTAAFLQRFDGPVDDLVSPIEYTLADTQIGEFGYGVTTLPHIRDFSITGPHVVTGISDTPSRHRIFSCRPTSAADERTCAASIFKRLATQAYRQPATSGDVEPLLKFYDQGRKDAGFEGGIRLGVQAILISPRFLFRIEDAPAQPVPGSSYRIADVELASRLSFMLWDTGPDPELLKAAAAGDLRTTAGLDTQVRRMLADPRSEALSTRFAAQWLRLQDVDKIRPDALLFTAYDEKLAQSFKRETELLFNSIVREDRSVLDLLTADYTFVNERLARHYGIQGVVGDTFRRVPLGPDREHRRGILGQGSVLLMTSVADRTSPVQRGKWILEVLLGSPPPPPPPNVSTLDDGKAVVGGKLLSTRQRMEEHRKSAACASCHRVIDPLGLALENFDVTGQWRIKDHGVVVDSNGDLYDGTKIVGPDGLRQALLAHSETVLRTFTENLMAYSLGRRVEYFDQPTIRSTVRKAEANGNRFSAFVLGIVNSAAFQRSLADARTTDHDGSGR
jgi:cytochrome c551/c552